MPVLLLEVPQNVLPMRMPIRMEGIQEDYLSFLHENNNQHPVKPCLVNRYKQFVEGENIPTGRPTTPSLDKMVADFTSIVHIGNIHQL
jgi:hypothetical protein